MRKIAFHRRADRALSKILENRAAQIVTALEEVATFADVSTHQNLKPLTGKLTRRYHLRTGSYCVVFELHHSAEVEVLF